ncbi:VOC family protein [Staphylococcus arlettae]|uniref:VOC family protein n=1 Tax=Staphylococcus arlettae TaxID=29378 RepID=UPI000DCBCDFB|nr:VOC family protein [Staphylococcus arlettae]RBA04463.1 3-demethylubiquinone-9 3-methyltransferase [Staphylococcus arlettae]RBA05770.1 3-demethylubiquinone-9 3-methyltransferase [Staphylococcus arlettae]RBA08404.1 3-demethylubiquinone-9 3-methyltransferase [Staphylococcus arlettae]
MSIPKVTTFLMFNGNAEEAINLYMDAFEDAEILSMVKYDEESGEMSGAVQHAIFRIKDQVLMAIDNINGVDIEITPAMSLYVTVDNAMEMERLFSKLKSGGAILMPKTEMPPTFKEFTWIVDRFGVNFQLALPEEN